MRATSEKDLSFQYFPFYVWAYLDSIAIGVLSLGAEACYHRLNARQWKAHAEGAVLPLAPAHMRLLTKATPIEWRDIWPELEGLYPVTEDGRGRCNPELFALWQERAAYLAQQKINGQKGGRPPGNPDESQQKATGSQKPRKTKPNQNPQETDGFPLGSVLDPENSENGNPTETSKLLVVTPLSPPPSGGGASPTPPRMRVLPGGKGNSTPAADPFAGPAIDLEQLLAEAAIPESERAPIRELLEEHSRPARWAGWVRELRRLVEPTDQEAVPLTWEAIAQGLRELLLVNPDGQRITLNPIDIFARAAMRRTLRQTLAGPSSPAPITPDATDPFAEYAAAQAAAGDATYVEYCHAHGIAFPVKETA